MTTLAAPSIRSQLSAATDPWSDCGEADCASVISDAGSPVSVQTVASFSVSSGNALGNGETTGPNLVAVLAHFGVSAQYRNGPLSQTIPAALAQGHEVIVLITSNDYGFPSPGTTIGHWLLCFGDSGGYYQVMQPLGNPPGGSLQNYPQSLLQQADEQEAVEIMEVLPKDQTHGTVPPTSPPTTSPPSGGNALPALLIAGGGAAVVGYALWRRPDLRRELSRPFRVAQGLI